MENRRITNNYEEKSYRSAKYLGELLTPEEISRRSFIWGGSYYRDQNGELFSREEINKYNHKRKEKYYELETIKELKIIHTWHLVERGDLKPKQLNLFGNE